MPRGKMYFVSATSFHDAHATPISSFDKLIRSDSHSDDPDSRYGNRTNVLEQQVERLIVSSSPYNFNVADLSQRFYGYSCHATFSSK